MLSLIIGPSFPTPPIAQHAGALEHIRKIEGADKVWIIASSGYLAMVGL